jgi:hypothetical protein
MDVAEDVLSVTTTVSPVLYAVVLAVSQIDSAVWALAWVAIVKAKSNAKAKAVIRFIEYSIAGRTVCVRPAYLLLGYAGYSQDDGPVKR